MNVVYDLESIDKGLYISENCRLCLVVVVVGFVVVSTVASFYMEIWSEVFSQSDCRSLMYRDSPG